MNCFVCKKKIDHKPEEYVYPVARMLCTQCREEAKRAIRSAEKISYTKKLIRCMDERIILTGGHAMTVRVGGYFLSKKEFNFLFGVFINNFSGSMQEKWPALKSKNVRINKKKVNPLQKITEEQLETYLAKITNKRYKNNEVSTCQ